MSLHCFSFVGAAARRGGVLLLCMVSIHAPLAAQRGVDRVECTEVQTPTIHSITDWIDLPALIDELARMPFVQHGRPDRALIHIAFDSTGVRVPPTFSHPTAPDSVTNRVESVLARYTAQKGEPLSSAFGVLVFGEAPGVEVPELTRFCPPALLNRTEIMRALRARRQTHRAQAVVLALVRPDGTVKEARIHRTSGRISADAAFVEIAQMARYKPAQVNEFASSAWVLLPLAAR